MTAQQEALAEWLTAHKFDTFATMTFGQRWPNGPSLEAVRYHCQRFLSEHRVAGAFLVAERGASGLRRWHGHGLLQCGAAVEPEGWRRVLWEDWRKRYGRSTFEGIDCVSGPAWYVTKYLTKGLPTDWWITPDGRWE